MSEPRQRDRQLLQIRGKQRSGNNNDEKQRKVSSGAKVADVRRELRELRRLFSVLSKLCAERKRRSRAS